MPRVEPLGVAVGDLLARGAIDQHRVRQVVASARGRGILTRRAARPAASASRQCSRSMRCPSSSIFFEPAIARTRRSRSNSSRSASPAPRSGRAACRRPSPGRARRSTPSSPTDRSCCARRGSPASLSFASMTAEMLRSDAPCAIARTLMPAAAERAEEFACAARHAGHVVADDRDDRAARRRPRRAALGPARARPRTHAPRRCARARPRPRAPRSRSNAPSCPARSSSPTRRPRAARRTTDPRCPARRSCPRPRGSRVRRCRCR